MSIGRYASECKALGDELVESLTKDEILELHHLMTGMTIREWVRFRVQQQPLVKAFVAATPSKRKKRAVWQPHRLMLTLAAVHHCYEANIVLFHAGRLRPAGSYRDMAAFAGELYKDVTTEGYDYWPWQYYCDDPFDFE